MNNKFLFLNLSLLLILFLNVSFSDNSMLSNASILFEKKVEKGFYANSTNPREIVLLFSHSVKYEAIVQFSCHLFPNSSNDVTLLVEPISEWNISHVKVDIGHEINKTVTNGHLEQRGSDVEVVFTLFLQRKNTTDEVQGWLVVIIVTYGWQKAP